MRRVIFPILLSLTLSSNGPAFAQDGVQEPGTSILLYHRFRPGMSNFTTVTNENFENQIVWLKEHGFNFVKLSTIVDAMLEGREPPAKSVAITVDDGHFTQYKYMYPILQKYQVPATLFIYTDGIASKPMPSAISWDELREMQASGLIDIQAHSLTHPDFQQKRKSLSPDAFNRFAMNELVKSKLILEDKLGHKVSYFAWPYGAFDRSIEKLAERAGYIAAFGTDGEQVHAQSNMFAIPRFHVMNDVIGDRIASIVMPTEKHRTRIASPIEKNASPPRIKVKPVISTLTQAANQKELHDATKLVSSDTSVTPVETPAGD